MRKQLSFSCPNPTQSQPTWAFNPLRSRFTVSTCRSPGCRPQRQADDQHRPLVSVTDGGIKKHYFCSPAGRLLLLLGRMILIIHQMIDPLRDSDPILQTSIPWPTCSQQLYSGGVDRVERCLISIERQISHSISHDRDESTFCQDGLEGGKTAVSIPDSGRDKFWVKKLEAHVTPLFSSEAINLTILLRKMSPTRRPLR